MPKGTTTIVEAKTLFKGIDFTYDVGRIEVSTIFGHLDPTKSLDQHSTNVAVIECIKKSNAYKIMSEQWEAEKKRILSEHDSEVKDLNLMVDFLKTQVQDLTKYKDYYDLTINMKRSI